MCCPFAMVVKAAIFGATGGNPSGSRPNFFGRQHLTFDKGGKCDGAKQGIVRFWKGWCGARADGVASPPAVARIFVGDSTSPLTRNGQGCLIK